MLDDVTYTGRGDAAFANQLHCAIDHPLARPPLLICHTSLIS
jgi:hypothetical protein